MRVCQKMENRLQKMDLVAIRHSSQDENNSNGVLTAECDERYTLVAP